MPLSFLRRFALPALLLVSAGCNLQKDIDVPTPDYPTQLVVECYLVPGQPYRLLVQRTQPFDAPPPVSFDGTGFTGDPSILGLDATAIISGPRGTDTIRFLPSVDTVTGTRPQFFTHTGVRIFDGQPGETFSLTVYDTEGRRVTGTSTVLQPVPIDTVEIRFNPGVDSASAKAGILARYRDPAAPGDAYRYTTNRVIRGRLEEQQSFELEDTQFNGLSTAVGSSYRFSQGDTLDVALTRISRAYYRFVGSVEDAQNANGNPFAQPAAIKSTVSGGVGVFTSLATDRRRVILKRR